MAKILKRMFTLTERIDKMIDELVHSGDYISRSEFIRCLVETRYEETFGKVNRDNVQTDEKESE